MGLGGEGEGSGGEISGPSGGGEEVEGREKVEEWELWVEEGG